MGYFVVNDVVQICHVSLDGMRLVAKSHQHFPGEVCAV